MPDAYNHNVTPSDTITITTDEGERVKLAVIDILRRDRAFPWMLRALDAAKFALGNEGERYATLRAVDAALTKAMDTAPTKR